MEEVVEVLLLMEEQMMMNGHNLKTYDCSNTLLSLAVCDVLLWVY